MRRTGALLCVLAWLLASGGVAVAQEGETAAEAPERTSGSAEALEDVEGTVVALDTETAEGDLPVLILDLRTEEGERRVALAPETVLAEAGFEVAEGDRVRVRVFVGGDTGPALAEGARAQPAQKVMNLSRNLLLRLRTFSRAPIWDARGRWEGSPTRGDERARRPHRPGRRQPPPPSRPPPPPPTRPPPGA